MTEDKFLIALKGYVFFLFKNKLSQDAVYHNFNHTLQVVEASQEIAVAEKVSDTDLEILLIAAWFHDTGYVKGYEKHEEESKKIAKEYLAEHGYADDKTLRVLDVIDATVMPQKPKNTLDKIICDADLFHLGMDNYSKKASLIRSEIEQLCGQSFTDIEWMQENNTFLTSHSYFTNYAFEKLNEQKTLNVLKVQRDLKKAVEKKNEQDLKIKTKSEELKLKKNKEERPNRGIETMFRVTLRNHIKLSDIADSKANILLSVSAIMMSIALSTLFPKLEKPGNAYLIYPTLIFILTSVITMVISILSTRPKVTSGVFTKADVVKKKVNLLFFGNFHKMKLDDFESGMDAIMNDRDYLYKSLMKDLYFLGVVLNKKYKLLRVAYTVFMIGIIITVFSFILSFVIMRRG
ncbi:MAG: DUF5706 domain-containing protein [Urechidicola sp.]|nr:DUF5706 domain-containing protein [Urechidicola sp.]